jgi:hypothetical protein
MEGFKKAINILASRTGATYAVIDGNRIPKGLTLLILIFMIFMIRY